MTARLSRKTTQIKKGFVNDTRKIAIKIFYAVETTAQE
jgi:hypothetical protein